MKRSLKIYIQTTLNCNLKCKHCYLYANDNSNKVLEKSYNPEVIVEYIRDFVENYNIPQDNIRIAFHGGEPFLARDSFDRALKGMEVVCNAFPDAIKEITTNLTIGDIGKIKDFTEKYFNGKLKTSWDPTEIRFWKDSSTEDCFFDRLEYLISNGIKVSVSTTLTDEFISKYRGIEYIKMMKPHRVKYINFERLTEPTKCIKPSNRKVDEWLTDLYLSTKDDTDIDIQLFNELRYAMKGIHIDCRARQCMSSVITINPFGYVFTCPNMSTGEYIDYIYGHDAYCQEYHEELIKREQRVNPNCYACKVYHICNGDCCQLKWDRSGCPGLKKLITTMIEMEDKDNVS